MLITTLLRTPSIVAVLSTAFLLTACTGSVLENSQTEKLSGDVTRLEDLPVPDVIARVNGEEIAGEQYKALYDQAMQMAAMQGQDSADFAIQMQIRQDVRNQLIGQALLMQAAAKEDIMVDDADVESEFQMIVKQVGGVEAMAGELAKAGMTEQQLRSDIHNQIRIRQYLRISVNVEDIVVTEEEVRAFYDEVSEQQEGVPPFAEVQEQVRTQLWQEREQKLIAALVDELRSQADVDILY